MNRGNHHVKTRRGTTREHRHHRKEVPMEAATARQLLKLLERIAAGIEAIEAELGDIGAGLTDDPGDGSGQGLPALIEKTAKELWEADRRGGRASGARHFADEYGAIQDRYRDMARGILAPEPEDRRGRLP